MLFTARGMAGEDAAPDAMGMVTGRAGGQTRPGEESVVGWGEEPGDAHRQADGEGSCPGRLALLPGCWAVGGETQRGATPAPSAPLASAMT